MEIFEDAFGAPFEVQRVPEAALEERYAAADPIQKTFAALGLSLARGDPIPDARETAARFGIELTSVRDCVGSLRTG